MSLNQKEVPSKKYWVREYICHNIDCCDGYPPIQVTHSIDTKIHICSYCGVQCEFIKTVNIINI